MTKSLKDAKQNVVVLGVGMAGLIAAIEGAAAGAQVTVLDKLSRTDICSNTKSTSPFGSGNETSRAAGGGLGRFSDPAPVEELLKQHVERGQGRIAPDLIRAYLERVAGDCRWLRDEAGLPYEGVFVKGGGPSLWMFLYEAARERGVNVLLETKAIELLTDDSGAITGVRTRTGKGVTDFKAGAAVLATGSFEGNQEMMLKYVGSEITYGTVCTGCPTNTGDGHLMALEIGAQLTHMDVCHLRTTDRFWGAGMARHLRHIYHLGLLINNHCQRFVDEGVADSDTIANAIVLQPDNKAALIFDEKARSKYPEEYETYPRKEETIEVAGTIEELATKIELSPDSLKNVIGQFNAAVSEDKALGLPVPKTDRAYKIDTPPFYGFYPITAGLNHPLGGLKINSKTQVLDMESNPIPGLYAAGSIANWAFGHTYNVAGIRSYMGSYHAGNSGGLPVALVFGRIAGRNAAGMSLSSKG